MELKLFRYTLLIHDKYRYHGLYTYLQTGLYCPTCWTAEINQSLMSKLYLGSGPIYEQYITAYQSLLNYVKLTPDYRSPELFWKKCLEDRLIELDRQIADKEKQSDMMWGASYAVARDWHWKEEFTHSFNSSNYLVKARRILSDIIRELDYLGQYHN